MDDSPVLRVDGTAWTFHSNGFAATGALYEGRIAYLTLGGNLTRRGIEDYYTAAPGLMRLLPSQPVVKITRLDHCRLMFSEQCLAQLAMSEGAATPMIALPTAVIVSPADFKSIDVDPVCPVPAPTPWK